MDIGRTVCDVEYHGAMCLVAHNTDGGSFYICSITYSKQEWLTPP
jgi:hypothetical protein